MLILIEFNPIWVEFLNWLYNVPFEMKLLISKRNLLLFHEEIPSQYDWSCTTCLILGQIKTPMHNQGQNQDSNLGEV